MTTTSAPSIPAGNFRAVQRRLQALDLTTLDVGRPTLESQRPAGVEPPRLVQAKVIEGDTLRRQSVPGAPTVGFAAFLDGIQASRVLRYDGTIPIIHGSVGAVIRFRTDRRLSTWRVTAEARVYAARALLSRPVDDLLTGLDVEVVDTTRRRSDGEIDDDAHHPLALADLAVNAVQWHREALEQRLADDWIERGEGTLYVDGGISGSRRTSSSDRAIGVVKSHRTLYGDPTAVRTVLSLTEGERSSVFTIESPDWRRSAVASWYLRLRDAAGRDPLWGLVRVEIALPATGADAGLRADDVSRWILAEAAPLSLPDSRWDTMVYGIHDCEQFLRSAT